MCYSVLEMSSISWITAELVIVDNIRNPGLDECYRVTYVTTLLPEPTMKFKVSYDTEDAEERGNVRFHGSTGLFQILKCTAFDEPRCSTLVMRISRNEVIYRRIWRRERFRGQLPAVRTRTLKKNNIHNTIYYQTLPNIATCSQN